MCLVLIKYRAFIIISLVLMYTNRCTSLTSTNNTTVKKSVNETSTTESKKQMKMDDSSIDSKEEETTTAGSNDKETVTLIPMPKLNKTMKAIVLEEFGSPANFKVKELPIPEPGEYEILVQVKAVGLNFVDAQMRSGKFSKLPALPAILGKEAAGIVVRNGNKTAEFSVGERVLCCFTGTGAYAEYVVCKTPYVVRLCDKLTFQQASTLYVSYFTAYRALIQKAQLKRGEIVYIHGGTGGLGIAALQIAKSYSCKVISSYGSLEGRDLLIKLGADHVHSHKLVGHSLNGFEAAGIRGYDVVLETVADQNLAEACFSLNKNGRVVVIGSKGDVQFNPFNLILQESSIDGVMLSKTPELDFFNAYIAIIKGINDGWVEPVVDRVYKPEDIAQAHIDMETKIKTLGKFVLEF